MEVRQAAARAPVQEVILRVTRGPEAVDAASRPLHDILLPVHDLFLCREMLGHLADLLLAEAHARKAPAPRRAIWTFSAFQHDVVRVCRICEHGSRPHGGDFIAERVGELCRDARRHAEGQPMTFRIGAIRELVVIAIVIVAVIS